MADITLCSNKDCPKIKTCNRASIHHNKDINAHWQSYCHFECLEDCDCDYYEEL